MQCSSTQAIISVSNVMNHTNWPNTVCIYLPAHCARPWSPVKVASTVVLRYSHVLKTDDDCYVRVSKLVNLVKKLARDGDSMLYAGRQVYIQISRFPDQSKHDVWAAYHIDWSQLT